MNNQTSVPPQVKPHAINVQVRYPAAVEPYHDHLTPSTTVGELKTLVLQAFGLTDGAVEQTGTVTYDLIYNRTKLTDPNETLGRLVGDHPEVKMALAQVITQG
ncbi:hypothetical protein [Deinococcus sonorensis]|uniref:Thiamine biosynthesis protein ThiS n=2 Tax=Deinococcus sonorensis TaxID=309891 RepID=A0AAU7UHR8_9DEIO